MGGGRRAPLSSRDLPLIVVDGDRDCVGKSVCRVEYGGCRVWVQTALAGYLLGGYGRVVRYFAWNWCRRGKIRCVVILRRGTVQKYNVFACLEDVVSMIALHDRPIPVDDFVERLYIMLLYLARRLDEFRKDLNRAYRWVNRVFTYAITSLREVLEVPNDGEAARARGG